MSQKKRTVFTPLQQFLKSEVSGGILLIFCTLIAMLWANSPWKESYHHLLELPMGIELGSFQFQKTMEFWINDLLMAIFFLLVGSEIKRELIAGELSDIRKAALPIGAAIGGMVVPGFLYTLFNYHHAGSSGWGIPTATDIAFSLGVLSLLGKRVPFSLKIFLTALAIMDDLGAVMVIALFYTSKISVFYLLLAALVFGLLLLINRLKIYALSIYLLLGIILWYLVYQSGIHATIAGVLVAIAIPSKRKIREENTFLERVFNGIQNFRNSQPNEKNFFLSKEQSDAVHSINIACEEVISPQSRLIQSLHPWITFFIMPVFAIANAGIDLDTNIGEAFTHPVTFGVILGLFVGKQLGIFFGTLLLVKSGIGSLPVGINWKHIYGMSVLAGIGFTMSLFISQLAFNGIEPVLRLTLLNDAKIGIIIGSLISGIWGYLYLRWQKPVNSSSD